MITHVFPLPLTHISSLTYNIMPGHQEDARTVTISTSALQQTTFETKIRNPVFKKFRQAKRTKLIQTLNNAKTIWDPKCKPKGFFCCHANFSSIGNKREQLEQLLQESNIDCLGIGESWLKKSSSEALVSMPGYKVFRKDRVGKSGGGVLLYVKNHLKCRELVWPDGIELECVGIEISLSKEMSFNLICLYRHPTSKVIFYEQLYRLLKSCDTNKETIIFGDFNVNYDDEKCRKNLEKTMDAYNFTQLIEKSTRITNISSTRIDLVFTNKPDRITKTYNMLSGLSDHNIIFFSRKLTKKRLVTTPKTPLTNPLHIPKNNQLLFGQAIRGINWADVLSSDSLNENCNSFVTTVRDVTTAFSRRRCHNTKIERNLPWLDQECRTLLKSRDLLLKQSLKSGLTTDRQRFTHARNKVTQTLRKAKANFFIRMLEGAKGNGKRIWQTLKKLLGKPSPKDDIPMELKIDNHLENNPSVLASTFNNYFLDSVLEITQHFAPSCVSPNPIKDNQPIFELEVITETEVRQIVKALKGSKARDVHGFDTNFLKTHIDSLAKPITKLVNQSISCKEFPSPWKIATVTPIFKSGDRTSVTNYRPISILPIISKIAEKWVSKLVMKHLDKGFTPLHQMQFGYRAHHSTETANSVLIEKVTSLLDRNPCVGAVFLDLSRAFDTVNTDILLSKLTYFNFSPSAVKWFRSYLTNRKQCVRVDGVSSSYLDNHVGVPQGSILGPLLFSMYINDLPDVCPKLNIQMYADDAVIFIHGKNQEIIASSLTNTLNLVQQWLKDNCLMLNAKKTVCMFFAKQKTSMSRSNVFLEGKELELVTQFKYLGVILDPTLSFKKHTKKVSTTVNFCLQNFKHIRPFLSTDAAKIYLHSMIFSHIEYCFTNWCFANETVLEPVKQLFKKAIKVLDKKPYSYHHCTVLDKYHLLNFDNFKTFKSLCAVYKCMNGLVLPPMGQFINRKRETGYSTRSDSRGDCEVQFRNFEFGKNVLSIKGCISWNNLPTTIRESPTFPTFKNRLKTHLRTSQICNHY